MLTFKLNVMQNNEFRHFSAYSLNDFNDLLSEENQITESDNFSEICDKIEADGLSYFYISMNPDDVEEAINDEPEMAEMLGLNLIEVTDGNGFYIATY